MSSNEHGVARNAPQDGRQGKRPRHPTTRSAAWKIQRGVSEEWLRSYETTAARFVKARTWQPFIRWYLTQLPHLLLWLRTHQESSLVAKWERLCRQYDTHNPKKLAKIIRKVMETDNSSCIYWLLSPSSSMVYRGLVYKRPAAARTVEPLAELANPQGLPKDDKYVGMAKQDPASLRFIISESVA